MVYLPTFERPDYPFAREFGWPSEVDEYHRAIYDAGFIFQFDWGAWHAEAERFFGDPAALVGADEAVLRRLLTFHIRKERFVEDHILEILRSGHVAAVLRRAGELRRGRE